MANRQHTYQWINGVVQVVDSPEGSIKDAQPRPRSAPSSSERKKPPALGIQTGLLIFTLSSVLMVFAGLGLFAFCFVLYSLIFG